MALAVACTLVVPMPLASAQHERERTWISFLCGCGRDVQPYSYQRAILRASVETTSDATNVTNRPIAIYRRGGPKQPWRYFSTWHSNIYGDLQPSVSDTRRRWQYQLRFAGDRQYLPARSRVFTVESSMVVSAFTDFRWSVSLGNAIPLRGQVDPMVGRLVQIQRETRQGWRTVGTARLRADGTYSTSLRPTSSGDLVYRVRHRGDHLRVPGVSESITVRVYAARISAVHASDAVSQAQDLNRESIVVRNTGRVPVPISSWTLTSNAVSRHEIPGTSILRVNRKVIIHSGRGRSRPGHIYLGRRVPMWTASGLATLHDQYGDVVHERRHGPPWDPGA